MRIGLQPRNARRLRGLAIASGVILAHLGLALLLAPVPPLVPPVPQPPAFDVVLVSPPPPPPPPPVPPPAPARVAGGGAPAAPSRVHIPPKPVVQRPPEIIAPPVQAPEPALIVGVAPIASPTPGQGQGGEGTGQGAGTGAGSGPGSGSTGPRFMRGPSRGDILREYPPAARAARRAGRAQIRCTIQLDTRLDDCRVIEESPRGVGFGEAALRVAAAFRFQPPTTNGRPREQEVTLGVEFTP